MTDNTQELDEIIGTHMGSGEIFPRMSKKEAKQAILDWHNKQIEEVLDRIADAWSSSERLKHTNATIGEEVFIDAVEAERNKLNPTQREHN